MKLKLLLRPLALVIALEVTFIICFFTGTFWNPPVRIELFDPLHRYYINRGYPKSWTGVSRDDKTVSLPFVKMPYTGTWMDGVLWVKIIDMRVFVFLFIALFIVAYYAAYQLDRYYGRLKFMITIKHLLILALAVVAILIYIQWFPRI